MAELERAPHKRMPNNFYWDLNECGWVQADAVQADLPAAADTGDREPMKPD